MSPVGMTMLFRAFPQAERVRASSILVLVFGALFLADQDHPAAGRFDAAGFVTSSSGLGLVMYGVSEGPNTGWTRGPVVASIAVGALLLAAMVVIELRTAAPLLDLRVYADRLFRPASIVLTLTSVAFFGLLFLLALFFQNGLHLSALQAGSAICPEAVGVIISSQFISRRLYPAIGPRRITGAGLLLIAVISALHPVRTVAGHAEANIQAFHTGLLVCAGVAVAAALAAQTIRDGDAAATMVRRQPDPEVTPVVN